VYNDYFFTTGNCPSVSAAKTIDSAQSENEANSKYIIAPNPVNNTLYVKLPDNVNVNKVTITITDIYGKQIKKINTVSLTMQFL
jgi:hypothetical protein